MNEIYHRVSIRKFKQQPIEQEKILQILKAGMQAPSACNQQPWEFYVVESKEKIKQLSKATPYASPCANAPIVIVPVYKTDHLPAPMFAQIDLSISQENMWLEADSLGLGGVWIGIAPLEDRMKEVEQILDIPSHLHAFSLFAVGYPAESRLQQNRFDENRIHYCR